MRSDGKDSLAGLLGDVERLGTESYVSRCCTYFGRRDVDGGLFECSNCGETWELTCGGLEENHLLFCPNCGWEIVEGDDGGDDDDDR